MPVAYGHELRSSHAMIDFLERSIKTFIQFGQTALAGGNIWILVLAVLISFGLLAAIRGKLGEASYLWIPLMALALWYAFYRLLRLRA